MSRPIVWLAPAFLTLVFQVNATRAEPPPKPPVPILRLFTGNFEPFKLVEVSGQYIDSLAPEASCPDQTRTCRATNLCADAPAQIWSYLEKWTANNWVRYPDERLERRGGVRTGQFNIDGKLAPNAHPWCYYVEWPAPSPPYQGCIGCGGGWPKSTFPEWRAANADEPLRFRVCYQNAAGESTCSDPAQIYVAVHPSPVDVSKMPSNPPGQFPPERAATTSPIAPHSFPAGQATAGPAKPTPPKLTWITNGNSLTSGRVEIAGDYPDTLWHGETRGSSGRWSSLEAFQSGSWVSQDNNPNLYGPSHLPQWPKTLWGAQAPTASNAYVYRVCVFNDFGRACSDAAQLGGAAGSSGPPAPAK